MLFLQDPSVTQLTQDLAKILGLKIRKAYVRSKVCFSQELSQTPVTLSQCGCLLHVIVNSIRNYALIYGIQKILFSFCSILLYNLFVFFPFTSLA